MTATFIRMLAVAIVAALVPVAASAHTGVGSTTGFIQGFGHPLSGLDHLLAMVMVGIAAWQLGGRALWALPATFVCLMALGGALGAMALALPFTELGIALSVVVLGAIVALGVRIPLAVATAIVAFFAIFHGHAHGSEMPETASGVGYAAGFMIATALLHLSGIIIGFLIGEVGERLGNIAVRMAGGLTALAGVAILAQL